MTNQQCHWTQQELVDAVRANALKHYDKGGDIVIETMDTSDIVLAIQGAKTPRGAITKMWQHTGAYREQRDAVRNEIF